MTLYELNKVIAVYLVVLFECERAIRISMSDCVVDDDREKEKKIKNNLSGIKLYTLNTIHVMYHPVPFFFVSEIFFIL